MNRPCPDPYTPFVDGSGTDTGRLASASPPQEKVRTQPTQQGVVYLWTIAIFAGVLWWQGENLVFLLGTLALGSGAVAWFLSRRNLRGLQVDREVPFRTQAGLPTPITWPISCTMTFSSCPLDSS